jgi:hypothetical protein
MYSTGTGSPPGAASRSTINVWRWFLLICAVLAIMGLLAVATAANAQTGGL